MPPHQSKANALLDAPCITRKSTGITKGNPYATLPKSLSKASSGFQKRNARDTGSKNVGNIPQTKTDQLLMGLLDGKPKKTQQKQGGLKPNSEKGTKRTFGSNSDGRESKRSAHSYNSLSGILPPPSRSYPIDTTKKKVPVHNSVHDGLLMPPPARSYPGTNNKGPSGKLVKDTERAKCTRDNSVKRIISHDEKKGASHNTRSLGRDVESFTAKKSFADTRMSLDAEERPLRDGMGRTSSARLKSLDSSQSPPDALMQTPPNREKEVLKTCSAETAKPLLLGIGKRNRSIKNPRSVSSSLGVGTQTTQSTSSHASTVPLGVGTQSTQSTSSHVTSSTHSSTATQSSVSIEVSSDELQSEQSASSAVVNTIGNGTANPKADSIHNNLPKQTKAKHAEWYDAQEHALIKASSKTTKQDTKAKKPTQVGINDNFVRLDLKNSAGSCRGARNLKKVNKKKAWRAKYRFGKGDAQVDEEEGEKRPTRKRDEMGEKCFASARNGGVDPLDDFMDGVFSSRAKKSEGSKKDGVACTRHGRPCKLLTVKKNHKGNKGRKFYVCSMPKGEQCDFFKWEEDTMEATQRALLESSSNSGFIARQVAAAKARFKELTVPELRIEAKKRGLNATGKKDEILTRLVIWTRDEIADSVECDAQGARAVETPDTPLNGQPTQQNRTEETDESDDDEEECLDIVCAPKVSAIVKAPETTKMIDLSDDSADSSDDDSDDESLSCGGLNATNDSLDSTSKKNTNKAINAESTLHESLEYYFGYTDFREGQEWAIRRCMSNERTLLVAPTGQGKSLCYALPAALMEGICLVVSPLISLMQDQLRQLPVKIPAATLSGSMTAAAMALIIDDVLRGRYKVLYVSPERLASASFRRLIRPKFNVETRQYERQFPPVSLLCVDEAHCLSQWGHNFRPSYLRVKSLLPLIEPKSVLALTATAGPLVVRDICNTLGIPFDESPSIPSTEDGDVSGVQVLNCNRDNIDVFTLVLQTNDERQYLLHKILKEKSDDTIGIQRKTKNLPVEEGCLSKGSVIVYVWRQKDTELVAEQLIGAGVSGGVVCYHGGMDSNDRSRAQSKFLRGKARICVATVAFGLGINKPDICGVIHLCLPPSPEHYLQEIGRAGRDGRAAKAIALPLVDEMVSRHSLAHSDRLATSQLGVIFSTLQDLVTDALADIPDEAGVDLNADQIYVDGLHLALPVAQTVHASDCKEESIETILSLLEEKSSLTSSLLSVEGYLHDVATITLKRRSIDKLKKMEHVAQYIETCGTRIDDAGSHADHGGTAMDSGFFAYSYGSYKVSIVQVCRCMGPRSEPRHVYAALRRLQGNGELELNLDPSGRAMHLRIKQEGINLFRRKQSLPVSNPHIDSIITQFAQQFSDKERTSVGKVESMFNIMKKVSSCDQHQLGAEDDVEEGDSCVVKSSRLELFQELVHGYFSSSPKSGEVTETNGVIEDFPFDNKALFACLSSDVSSLLQVLRTSYNEQQTPTAVNVSGTSFADYRDLCLAKILHAIDAPRAPILSWYSHPLWGKYRIYSFSSVMGAVNSVFSDI